MSYSPTDNLCTCCRRGQQIGILGGKQYDVCRDCLGDDEGKPAPAPASYPLYWDEREAAAAGQVHPRRCLHGVPLNVFCDQCER